MSVAPEIARVQPGAAAAVLAGPEALDRLMPMHLVIGADGTIRAAGPTLRRLLAGDDPVGRRFLDLFVPRRPRALATMDAFAAHAGERLHLHLRRPPGTPLRGLAVPVAAGDGGRALLLNLSFGLTVAQAVRDHALTDADFAATDLAVEMLYLSEAKAAVMAELRALNERLQVAKAQAEEQALTDALTGLRNRRAMAQAIASALAAGRPLGVMQIDLDHFKAVNDTLGHGAGDRVLVEVAAILTRETRAGDTAARLGGDEFVILFPGLIDPARLRAIGERVRTAIERPVPYRGLLARVSASIGIVIATGAADADVEAAAEDLLRRVDQALYAAKNAGRARVNLVEAPGFRAARRP